MDSLIVKRGVGIFSIILFVILASVACSILTGNDEDPNLSDPEGIFMSFNGIEITNEMVYNRMKASDGITQLINYIDQQLLADYMDEVTQEQIENEILEQTYGTSDPVEIDLLGELEKAEMEQNFRDGAIFAGFNPDDQDAIDTYMRLMLAQDEYAKTRFRTTDETSDFYISIQDLEAFYNDYKQGDVIAIPLRFHDNVERDNVFYHFNLVRDYEGGFGLYHGDDPIEEIARDEFDEDNTDLLDDDEVLMYYIKMYNYLNQHLDPLDENATIEDLVALEREDLRFNQFALQELAAERQTEDFAPYTTMSDYLFKTLRDAENDYTVVSRSIGGDRLYFYALNYEAVPEFSELDIETDLPALRDELIETLLSDQFVERAMFDLHRQSDLKIHDRKLALSYEMQTGDNLFVESENSEDIVTFDGQTITVDDYFAFMVRRVGAIHALEVSKTEYMMASDYFESVYSYRRFFGERATRDVWENRSEMMRTHRNDLREEKTLFNNGAYAMFGISPEVYSWEQYLFLFGYGHSIRQYHRQMHGYHPLMRYGFSQSDFFSSEDDILRRMVEHTLRYELINDNAAFDTFYEIVELYYENYFNLNVEEIFIFMDLDMDFYPDDYLEYYDGLNNVEKNRLDTLRSLLHSELKTAVEDGEDLEDIVREYQRALRGEDETEDDYSRWARFKNAGFRLEYNDMSNDGQRSLTYVNTQNEVPELIKALQDIYAAYQREENSDEDFLVNEALTRTQFGMMFIRAEQGARFEKPSAQFDNEDGEYNWRLENGADIPSIDQIKAYTEMLIMQHRGEETDIVIPASLMSAIRTYYEPTLNRIISDHYFSVLLMDIMRESDMHFTEDDVVHKARLESLYDVYYRRLFPELNHD